MHSSADWMEAPAPFTTAKGMRNSRDQRATTMGWWCSHQTGGRQGHHGDAKQDTGEGDAHPKGSRGLGDLSRLAARSQHRDAEQKQGRQKNRDFFQ